MGHNNEMESTAELCILRSPGAVSWTEPERASGAATHLGRWAATFQSNISYK